MKRLHGVGEFDPDLRCKSYSKEYLRVAAKTYPSNQVSFKGYPLSWFDRQELMTIIAITTRNILKPIYGY